KNFSRKRFRFRVVRRKPDRVRPNPSATNATRRMVKRSLPALSHPVAWCRSRASHSHTCLRCDSPCIDRKLETGWDWETVQVAMRRLRYSAEKYDRKFLLEIFSPCLKTLAISSYKRRRI